MLTELIDLKTRPQALCLIGHWTSGHGASSPDPRCPQWEVCVVSGPASHSLAGAGPGGSGPASPARHALLSLQDRHEQPPGAAQRQALWFCSPLMAAGMESGRQRKEPAMW